MRKIYRLSIRINHDMEVDFMAEVVTHALPKQSQSIKLQVASNKSQNTIKMTIRFIFTPSLARCPQKASALIKKLSSLSSKPKVFGLCGWVEKFIFFALPKSKSFLQRIRHTILYWILCLSHRYWYFRHILRWGKLQGGEKRKKFSSAYLKRLWREHRESFLAGGEEKNC